MRRLTLLALVLLAACNDDTPAQSMDMKKPWMDPLKPVPECSPGSLVVTPFKGERALLLSSLRLAEFNAGFDLDLDGRVDNKLAPLGALANPSIADSFKLDHNLVIPVEIFGYDPMNSTCAKVAFYLGRLNEDRDADGRETSWIAGKADCDDNNPMVRPGISENLTNRIDDDCDGYADNKSAGVAPDDIVDADGDGQSLKDGDCDDRAGVEAAKTRKKGAAEICGNGIDEDCDGISDNGPTCDPFTDNKLPVHIDARSLVAPGGGTPMVPVEGTTDPKGAVPAIVFPNGTIKDATLKAGPSLFKLAVPFDSKTTISLTLDGARIELKLSEKTAGAYITEGKLGGVLEAATLAQITGIDAGGVIKKEQSLLDAIFAGPAATVLGLDSDNDQHYLPDIDVDGDGLETFWQEPVVAGKPAIVDHCKDGDGTVILNNWDGKGTSCALSVDPKTGKLRFVDGLSVALKFTAVPVTLKDITPK